MGGAARPVPQNVLIEWFLKVNSPTNSSTYCLLLLIDILSWRFLWKRWLFDAQLEPDGRRRQACPTECISQVFLESQLPHKIVNLLFTIKNKHIKLTVAWKSWLFDAKLEPDGRRRQACPTVSSRRMYQMNGFRKSTPPQFSTYCLLLQINILSWRLCERVDFLTPSWNPMGGAARPDPQNVLIKWF
jgi:hypothetical protein